MENILYDLEGIKVGDVVLLKEGRDNKLIAYTDLGKVILPANHVTKGYVKITKIVKNAEKFILAEMEHVVADYYDGISYEEFKQVLNLYGYKIGFERPFQSSWEEYGEEFQLFAYNLNNGIIIVAETFGGKESFNSIAVYCPNVNCFNQRCSFKSRGSGNHCVYDLAFARSFDFPLQSIHHQMEYHSKVWGDNLDLCLWTYADTERDEYTGNIDFGFECYGLWANTIDRLLLVDKEIEQLLGNCKRLIPVFKSRDTK